MNFQDFFRSFIGLNPRYYNRHGDADENPVNKFRNPPWGDDPDEDDDFDELYSDYRNGAPSEFGFNVFTGDAMQMHKYFEQQMNEMMKSFGSLGRFNFGGGMEDLMPELDKRRGPNQDVDVRDKYLKSPVGTPRFAITDSKTDSDIDDRVNDDGIGTLFKKESVEPQHLLPSRGGFTRSFTSRVIISNNGKVEERVKEWSSEGVERERVKRTLGDQIHSVTTSKDTAGQTQTEEQLINIDQDSLNDFDKKWSTSDRNVPPTPSHHVPNFVNPPPSSSHGIFGPLLRLFS